MSYQLFKEDVLFYQRFLKSNGFYKGLLDGRWGPKTDAADAAFVAQSKSIASQYGTYDSRSESNIATLAPQAQVEARKFLKATFDDNNIRIISGTRTYDEQDKLYKQGRSGNPGPIVTNAKGGQSNHNFGIAWDIGIFGKSGNYITDDSVYIAFSKAIMPQMQTIEWGGDWMSIKDYPHYQLKAKSDNVATIRGLFEDGAIYV